MDQFLEPFKQIHDISTGVTITKALISLLLSFILGLIITQVYKRTHHGRRYSQTFVHTIVIMGVVVSLIMIVIGDNVAVAFGLVGAFSIIRFRTAMSDPKDIAFIFFNMAAGIACGLSFYLLAFLFTISLSIFIYILYLYNYGNKDDTKTLKIIVPENMHYDQLFDDIFKQQLDYYSLVSVETTNLGTMIQLEYVIETKQSGSDKLLIDAIRERNANLKVSIGVLTFTQ